jgi:hypothetical protein
MFKRFWYGNWINGGKNDLFAPDSYRFVFHMSLFGFTAVEFEVGVFWVMTPCSDFIERYQRLGGSCFFYLQDEDTLISYHIITKRQNPQDHKFYFMFLIGIFLFTTASRMALGPTQPPIQLVPGALSLGVKRPGCEADHSPPSSAEVKG